MSEIDATAFRLILEQQQATLRIAASMTDQVVRVCSDVRAAKMEAAAAVRAYEISVSAHKGAE